MRIPGIPFHQGRNDYTDTDGMHYGIAIHNTSNTASDEAESSYADHRTDGTSSHFYVDADSVIQSLDTDDKAGHAGSREGNENAIAFEITGTNDKTREWWLTHVAWDRLGYVIAYILRHDPDYRGFEVRRASVDEMRKNPKVKAFYSHNDMRLAWGGTTHDDPGPGFPWDALFAAVNAALNPTPLAPKEEDDMGGFAKLDLELTETNIAVPGGSLGWKSPTYLAVCNDTFGVAYGLRIYTTTGDGSWTPIDADGLVLCQSGHVYGFPLPEQTRCVSIVRAGVIGTTVFDPTVPWNPTPPSGGFTPPPPPVPYAGHLSVALER